MVVAENEILLREKDLIFTPINEAKLRFFQGNYPFAIKRVFEWFEDREDYIRAKGAPERDKVYADELREYGQAKEDYWEKIREHRVEGKAWYEQSREVVDMIWNIAGEGADIAIVAISRLRELGWSQESVAKLVAGLYSQGSLGDESEKFRQDLNMVRTELAELGVDFAHAIIEKTPINEQHYSSSLKPWVHVQKIGPDDHAKTFSRSMRGNVGKIGSQMPDLVMSRLGETFLSHGQRSVFGSDGHSPKVIFQRDENNIPQIDPDYHGDGNESYGLYAMGFVKGLYPERPRFFLQEADTADYLRHITTREWRDVVNRIKKLEISRLVVPSASGYRREGIRKLGWFYDLEVEGSPAEKEIRWSQYLHWCEDAQKKPDFVEFQMLVTWGKSDQEQRYVKGDTNALVVALDEIIVWRQENGEYQVVEKPKNEKEAQIQIAYLLNGKKFYASSMITVESWQDDLAGRGIVHHMLPMRIRNMSTDERKRVGEEWLRLYREAAAGRGFVTPGGISMLHQFLQPYQLVQFPGSMDQLIVPGNAIYNEGGKLIKNPWEAVGGKETPYLELPDAVRESIGISIGGLSFDGLREALKRYVWNRQSIYVDRGDGVASHHSNTPYRNWRSAILQQIKSY